MVRIVLGTALVALACSGVACGSQGRPRAAPDPRPAEVVAVDPTPADVVALSELPALGGSSENVDDLIGAVRAYEAEHADVFAGVMLAGGRVWVGFTRHAAGHLETLRSRVERPHLLAAFTAEHSEQELRALQARITADMSVLERLGVAVSAVGVDVRRNRVVVSVRDRKGDRARAVLAERYDERLFFVEAGVEVRPVGARTR